VPVHATNQRDWFVATRADVEHLFSVPGIKMLNPQRWQIHRTHLPLVADGAPFLLRAATSDWTLRDKATEGRGFKLRNVQHAAVDFMQARRGTLLGDDPRVGKTLASIMAHDPASGPLVVICPAMVRPVWIGWLRRVFPDEPIGLMSGRTLDRSVLAHRLIVGHYEILPWWQSDLKIGTVIFDEAHLLTNRTSRRSKSAVFFASRAQRVIAATGTPIWNMPTDLWNVLGMVAPGGWGSFHDFGKRYGDPVATAYGVKYTGISFADELHARLTEVMIRRRWVDVADDLPPITRNVVLAEITDEQRKQLDIMALAMKSDKSTTVGHLAAYRQKLSKAKAKWTLAEATRLLDGGEPVVIWTWHTDLAASIAKALGERGFLLTGEVPGDKRDETINAWKATPAAALVCTMAVAQVGLDFSHAHLAIFAEIDYTPAILAQAEMRTFAPTRPMNVTYIVGDHVVDQRIVLALTRKLSASNPLGVGAANDAISALAYAVNGSPEEADLGQMLDDWLESA